MKSVHDYSYEELLDRGLSKISKGLHGVGGFEIPNFSVSIIGNRTIVNNFSGVVDYLNRDIKHVTSFLLKEVGTAGDIEGDKLVLHGRYSGSIIRDVLLRYANYFVICPICNSRDTYLSKERRLLFLVCTACGAKTSVSARV